MAPLCSARRTERASRLPCATQGERSALLGSPVQGELSSLLAFKGLTEGLYPRPVIAFTPFSWLPFFKRGAVTPKGFTGATEGEITRACCLHRGLDEHQMKRRSFAFSLAYIKCFRTHLVYLSLRLPAQILYAGIHLCPLAVSRSCFGYSLSHLRTAAACLSRFILHRRRSKAKPLRGRRGRSRAVHKIAKVRTAVKPAVNGLPSSVTVRCGAAPHRATFPKGKAKRLPPQTAELASESTGKPKYSLRKAAVSPVRLCAPHKSFPLRSFLIPHSTQSKNGHI